MSISITTTSPQQTYYKGDGYRFVYNGEPNTPVTVLRGNAPNNPDTSRTLNGVTDINGNFVYDGVWDNGDIPFGWFQVWVHGQNMGSYTWNITENPTVSQWTATLPVVPPVIPINALVVGDRNVRQPTMMPVIVDTSQQQQTSNQQQQNTTTVATNTNTVLPTTTQTLNTTNATQTDVLNNLLPSVNVGGTQISGVVLLAAALVGGYILMKEKF